MTLHLDIRDADRRHHLPVTAMPPIVLAPLELHDHDLAVLLLPQDLPGHLGRGEGLRLQRHLTVLVHQQDVRELHRGALAGSEPLHLDHLAGRDPVLLATGCDHCFHVVESLTSVEMVTVAVASAYQTTAPRRKSSSTGA